MGPSWSRSDDRQALLGGYAEEESLSPDQDSVQGVDTNHRQQSIWRTVVMTVRNRLGTSRRPQLVDDDDVSAKYTESIQLRPPPNWRSKIVKLSLRIVLFSLAFFGVIHLLNVLFGLGTWFWDDDNDNFLPDWGRPGHMGADIAHYPTDFTRDVLPIPCHSHNDYWRRVPLFEAIHYGCTGVEADVWLFDEDLYVGHNTLSLTRNRTFRNMYVNPLLTILNEQNPATEFGNASRNGVFDEAPEQTLTLLVDFKNSGEDIFPYVQLQLEALRSKKYLTYFDGEKVVPGPVTVVATGNAPFNLVTANQTYRDIFFDAPLAAMWEDPDTESTSRDNDGLAKLPASDSGQGTAGTDAVTSPDAFTDSNSYYASVSFSSSIGILWGGRISSRQMKLIRGQIRGARRRGLQPRYWDTPSWPVGLRNYVWSILVQEGVAYLNVDDLKAATKSDWAKRKHSIWE